MIYSMTRGLELFQTTWMKLVLLGWTGQDILTMATKFENKKMKSIKAMY